MQENEFQKGKTPADPELRWLADLRDMIRHTSQLIDESLTIRNVKENLEYHAYFSLKYRPGKPLMKATRDMCRHYAKAQAPLFKLQRVEFLPYAIRLVFFRKPQKKRKVR